MSGSPRFKRASRAACLGSLALALLAGSLRASRAAEVRAGRIETPPAIDGVLDEEIWHRPAQITRLVAVEPVEGAEPTERTEVWIYHDDEALYLGFRLHDREPDKLIAKQMTQDEDMTSDDRINLILDTFHDQRNGFLFQINPVGTRSEGLIQNNSAFWREWDTIWYGEASVDEGGWSAEIAIPFQSLPFDPHAKAWGLEIERQIRRGNEKARWANPSRNRTIIEMGGIGTLTGLEGMHGSGVDVKPTFSTSISRDRALEDTDRQGRPGLDVFVRPTSSVTAALTLNPDFSDAPVDDRQTNLTRFALFFPETRDFFLQDAGIFDFAGLTRNGRPFFSRRVGLIEATTIDGQSIGGKVVDLEAGLKLTGRIGDLNFGAMQVRTAREGPWDPTDLTVLRAQLNVLEASQLGMIFTRGDPRARIDNQLFGVDFRYRDSSFRESNAILLGDLWFQQSRSSGVGRHEAAFGARVEYPNDRINFHAGFTEIQKNFNPALGFVNRTGIRQYEGSFRFRVRPGGTIRTIDTGFTGTLITRSNDELDSAELEIDLVEIANQLGDTLALTYLVQEERPRESFLLDPEAIILRGRYPFQRYRITMETTRARPVKGKLEFTWGGFYDGVMQETRAVLELRPWPQLFLGIEYEQDDVKLPGAEVESDGTVTAYSGDFSSRLARVRLNLNFTPELSWTNLVQYDNSSDTIGINSRLRWEVRSGNELFFVINHEVAVDHAGLAPTTSQVTAKVAWTFRY